MNETEKLTLLLSLREAIETWWEAAQNEVNVPFVGENIFAQMARASISVLEAVDDAQKYLEENDMMKR